MPNRPKLSVGDLVKRNRNHSGRTLNNPLRHISRFQNYVVFQIAGDGVNGHSLVTIHDVLGRAMQVYRKQLWRTGYNIFSVKPTPMDDDKTPTIPGLAGVNRLPCRCDMQVLLSVGCRCGGA